MYLADDRLREHHGSFQKSESRKWPSTDSSARGVPLEVHCTGRRTTQTGRTPPGTLGPALGWALKTPSTPTRCEARCASLRVHYSVCGSMRQFVSNTNRQCVRAPYIHSYIHTYMTLHYITLHYITLHYITLHHITSHYIILHYITLYSLEFPSAPEFPRVQARHLAA